MKARMIRIGRTSFCVALLLAFCAVVAQPLFGATGEGFNFVREAWKATDIVLVEVTEARGTFEVVEIWKGTANIGERIFFPELVPRPGAKPLSEYPVSNPWESSDGGCIQQQVPKQPRGSRLVLFLKRKSSTENPIQWEATDFGSLMPIQYPGTGWPTGDMTIHWASITA